MSPLRRLYGYVRRMPGRYLLGAALTLGYALLFQLVPLAVRRIVQVIERDAQAEIAPAVAWLVAVAAVFAGFRLASRITLFRVGREIEYQIRNDYFAHLQRLPQSYFNATRTGDLMSRAVNDINSVRLFLGMGILNLVQTPILYLGALVVMFAIDPVLTLWVLVPYPLFIGIFRLFGRRMFLVNLAAQEQLGDVSAAVQENASGTLVVRAYALEDQERERFEIQNGRLYQRAIRVAMINAAMQPAVGLLPALAMVLVIWQGGWAVQSGRLASSDLWVFYMYIVQLTFPTFMVGFVIQMVQRGLAALQRLGEVFDTVPSIRERVDTVDTEVLEGRVEFRGLTFRYPDAPQPALAGVSLGVEAGHTLGIVGVVGAGKSTLVAAIPRLLEIDDGTLLIDGLDVNRLPLHLLRSSIAMVPQDSFLFSTTIAENIRFGCPDATHEEVREAARRAHVLEDIQDFPHGFDTPVGERGITLSGGQRQRIALARALILDPSILILDDALSSVDHATEEAILKELRTAKAGRTCFIVAHRLSAVRDADLIAVLEKGRLIEVGTHEELIRARGFYAKLYRQQQLEDELETEDVA